MATASPSKAIAQSASWSSSQTRILSGAKHHAATTFIRHASKSGLRPQPRNTLACAVCTGTSLDAGHPRGTHTDPRYNLVAPHGSSEMTRQISTLKLLVLKADPTMMAMSMLLHNLGCQLNVVWNYLCCFPLPLALFVMTNVLISFTWQIIPFTRLSQLSIDRIILVSFAVSKPQKRRLNIFTAEIRKGSLGPGTLLLASSFHFMSIIEEAFTITSRRMLILVSFQINEAPLCVTRREFFPSIVLCLGLRT